MSTTTDNSFQVAAYNCQVSATTFAGAVFMQGKYVGYKLDSGNPIKPNEFENQNMIAAVNEGMPSFWVVDAVMTYNDLVTTHSASPDDALMWLFMTGGLHQDGEDLTELNASTEEVIDHKVPSRKNRPPSA